MTAAPSGIAGALSVLAVLALACTGAAPPQAQSEATDTASLTPQPERREVILATTTSTQDSGLLDALVPKFQQETGYQLKVIAVGTGQALELGRRGEADVVLVHAPEAEQRWLAEGNGTERLLVMHNDFVIVGPAGDPARIRAAADPSEVMRRIALGDAPFASRGDGSGTHLLEQQLWRAAGVSPGGRAWYLEAGQGMAGTLNLANERRAYVIADRATYLAHRRNLDLEVLFEGAPELLNVYHVVPINPARNQLVNAAGGAAFAHWLVGPSAQSMIGEFGKDRYGQSLFTPDAGKQLDELTARPDGPGMPGPYGPDAGKRLDELTVRLHEPGMPGPYGPDAGKQLEELTARPDGPGMPGPYGPNAGKRLDELTAPTSDPSAPRSPRSDQPPSSESDR